MPLEKDQVSFGGGEVSPSLYAHIDLIKYNTGLKQCLNFFVRVQGGISNRAGLEYRVRSKDHTKRARLIPFQFSTTQNYILEFTDGLMRVLKDGGLVLEPAKNITDITKANPGVVTSNSHGFSNGDTLWLESIVGMTELNDRFVKVANKTTHTFELQDLDGSNINTTTYTTYVSGGTASRVFELATPYAEQYLRTLKYTQSADVMTLCHTEYQERDLSRTQHYAWSLATIDWDPEIAWPTSASGSGTAGAETFKYKVTSVARETGEESLSGTEATKNITAITKANPGVVTIAGHNYANGDELDLESIVGMTELNGMRVKANNVAANTFELQDLEGNNINTTTYGTYVSGGTAARCLIVVANVNAPATNDITTTWTAVSGAESYNVYREENGLYGYIGSTETTSFVDDGINPDLDDSPPKRRRPFDGGNYPGAVAYHKQRRVFGGSNDNPQKVYGTQVGNFKNMNISIPLKDDDAFTFTLDSEQVQQIRHITSLKKLILFTSGSTWKLQGADGGTIITPTSVDADEEIIVPSSQVRPLRIGRDIIYTAEGGKDVLYIADSFEANGLDGDSLTLISSHLFERREIVEWAYSAIPYSIIWCVMDDGTFLSLTYNRKQQVWAWTRHETDGYVESVASILEENEFGHQEDYVYFSVRRIIGGATKRFIERMHTREFFLVEDFFAVDSGLTLDNWNTNTTSTITVTGGTNWTTDETLTITENGTLSPFVASDVGRIIALRTKDDDGNVTARCKFEITAYTSSTVVSAVPKLLVPTELRAIATTHWSFAFITLSGLDHLEGETVSVLADGNVESQKVVSSGSITLDNYNSKVHVGLPYNSDFELLDVNLKTQGVNARTKKKSISEVTFILEKSRGFWAGPDENHLTEFIQREDEEPEEPTNILTGDARITINPVWSEGGRVFGRQIDPLPLTVSGIVVEMEVSQ